MNAIPVINPATVTDVFHAAGTEFLSIKKNTVAASIPIEITQNVIPTKSSWANKTVSAFADFEKQNGRWVICDFVAPTEKAREAFNPDFVIWLDTIKEGRFEDTNKMFEQPSKTDIKITKFLSDEEIEKLAKEIKNVWLEKANCANVRKMATMAWWSYWII